MRVRYFFAFLPLWLGVVSPPGQAAPPPLSVYGQLPVIETMAISPSGAHVALIGMAKGERRLLIFDKALKLVNAIPVVRTKIRGPQELR
jgi:hypothetical protein